MIGVFIKAIANISSWEEGYVEKNTFYATGMSSYFSVNHSIERFLGR